MNIQNLNSEELRQLQSLLNKMNPTPTEKVYLDPTNKMIDNIIDSCNNNINKFKFTSIEDGISESVDWFLNNYPNVRL